MQPISSLALIAAAVAGVYAQGGGQPQINTPASVVQCQPAQITFSGGTPPYFISIIPGGQVSAAPLENLGQQSGTSVTWNADIASGTSITFQIRDSQGVTAFSAPITIQGGTDSGCVGKNPQPSGTGSGTAAPPSTGATSPTSAASSGAAKPSSPASSPSATTPAKTTSGSAPASSGAASSSPASTPTNAAVALIPGSAAGLIGALLAAVVA